MPAISLDNLARFKQKLMAKLEAVFIKADTKGVANGVATLDGNGLVPSSQLPSYTDDVIENPTVANFPTTGETGKIYVATSTNVAYRWDATNGYVAITSELQLGTNHSNAFYGDYGQIAYAHASDTDKVSATTEGLYKISTSSEGHVKSLTSVTATDITALGIPAQDTTYEVATSSANGLMSSSDKTKLNGLANATVYFAECNSRADVYAKEAVCNIPLVGQSVTGALVFVKFANTNTSEAEYLSLQVTFSNTTSPTLPIKCQQKNELTTLSNDGYLIGGHIYLFECDGQNWVLMNSGNGYGIATSEEPGLMTPEDRLRLQDPIFAKLYYGTCITEMDQKDKKVLCPDLKIENLSAGIIVFVYFQYGNSASEDTLTMEVGSTGVKPLKCLLRGQIAKLPYPDYLLGYQTYMFQYDGTNWVLMNTDTNDDASFEIDESTGELMVTIY